MKTATTKTSGMLLPKKTIVKTQSVATSSIPKQRMSYGSYHLFMRDFRKSEDCESAIRKAAAEKWASLSEAEKYDFELKMVERTTRFDQYIETFTELKRKQKQDVDEDQAKAAPSTEKSNPDVDATEDGSS